MSTKNYSLGQVGDYEIKQLKVFKTVVDCGGFSAAETALNIGRSTISLHISNLESRLNLVLCKRGRAGFSLTEEGAIIYDMTVNLLESLDAFRVTVNNLNSSLTGELKIVLSDAISLDKRCAFPDLIRTFISQAPGVQLSNDVASMAEIERMVLNDMADVGFIPCHRKLEGLEYIDLFSDVCRLYISTDHPVAALPEDELTDDAIQSLPMVHAGLKPHEAVDELMTGLNLAGRAYFYEGRLAMILSGQYIGFLPEHYAQSYIEEGLITTLTPESRFYNLTMSAIWKKTAQPSKPRELFLSILRDKFASDT
ncbi:LysR family transcriptional regulator [Oceanospirillum sediminis]|uniref:LysR family transcriptional regulator n=1 Tax=Oceanospirillum sediminis TaxID=2760088 RepID=A0A839IRV4_9GAMM|nr:LysR family transcriptional regulator [Oceanospirillum sediminis]MBB1488055.1 LysR family transcriptional regulator [Oceanospirillum sediminis]